MAGYQPVRFSYVLQVLDAMRIQPHVRQKAIAMYSHDPNVVIEKRLRHLTEFPAPDTYALANWVPELKVLDGDALSDYGFLRAREPCAEYFLFARYCNAAKNAAALHTVLDGLPAGCNPGMAQPQLAKSIGASSLPDLNGNDAADARMYWDAWIGRGLGFPEGEA